MNFIDKAKNLNLMNVDSSKLSEGMTASQFMKSYKPQLQKLYDDVLVSEIKKKFEFGNVHEVPKISKIYITSNVSYKAGKTVMLEKIFNSLYLITGQIPVYCKCSRSISQFKIYKGAINGVKVCLTNKKMIYEFVERFAHIYVNYIKNFHGFKAKSLKNGRMNIGIADINIFPEIVQYLSLESFGLNIEIVMEGNKKKHGMEPFVYLLNALHIPVVGKPSSK